MAGRALRRAAFLATIPPLRRRLRARHEGPRDVPPPGLVRFGDLRRMSPISREWGADRGGAVDRYYIDGFLDLNRSDIRGRVMEVGEDVYTRRFGGDAVTRSDVLEYPAGSCPGATLVADLAAADDLPADAFDCVIVTQILQFVYDVRAAVRTLHHVLKPGGVALVTVPGISHINRHDPYSGLWCWNLTGLSMRRMFSEHFPAGAVEVETHGNVLAATAFLYGLGLPEVEASELDRRDPDYELLITVRATKEGGA
jgi:SAM-dependent methyltransferase